MVENKATIPKIVLPATASSVKTEGRKNASEEQKQPKDPGFEGCPHTHTHSHSVTAVPGRRPKGYASYVAKG